MAKLVYITNTSLDGFIEDADGGFDFAEPSDDYFAFVTDLIRDVGTYVYGRRLYESMSVWETDPSLAAQSAAYAAFAGAWQDADKVVHSSTLAGPLTARTRIERHFDPEAIRALKETADRTLTVGGADLAAQAFAAGLVDETQVFVGPATAGRGKPGMPTDRRLRLELVDQRRFANGVVLLHHRVR